MPETLEQQTGGGYGAWIAEQNRRRKTEQIGHSVNALAALAMTAGGGTAMAGHPDVGFPIMAGAGGAAVGYHGMLGLGASPEAALLAAGLMGMASAGAMRAGIASRG